MKNFYLRLISSLVIAPIFLYILYISSYYLYALLVIIFLLCCYEVFKNVKQKLISIFLYILIIFFILSLVNIRGDSYTNYIYLVWIIFIVWISDVAGYLVGKLVGGPKLSIYSPNKTLSGSVGSIFFSQFSFFVLLFFLNNFNLNFKIIFLQLILSIISILGDIFFSYVKRINQIKDYSAIIPGHGGVLDRVDGLIFVIIAYQFIIKFNVI